MKGSAIKDFLLFCLKCIIGLLRYSAGTIIEGVGCIMMLGGFIAENWLMAILGVVILLIGTWIQYGHEGNAIQTGTLFTLKGSIITGAIVAELGLLYYVYSPLLLPL